MKKTPFQGKRSINASTNLRNVSCYKNFVLFSLDISCLVKYGELIGGDVYEV